MEKTSNNSPKCKTIYQEFSLIHHLLTYYTLWTMVSKKENFIDKKEKD